LDRGDFPVLDDLRLSSSGGEEKEEQKDERKMWDSHSL